MTCKGCEFFFNPDELLSHLNLNLCSGKQSLNIHDNVDNNVEYDMEPQIEDGSDNAYLSENNLVNDSNCELISEIDNVEHKLEPISEEDNVKVESDYINHKTTCHGNTSSLQNQVTASTSQNLTPFVDCGPEIKEEIKEENVEFHDPLRLSYAVQSLDEPVTFKEFFA